MLYKLRPQWKKSVHDLEHWWKEINGKKVWIEREVGWRWGEATFTSEDVSHIDLENEHGFCVSEEELMDYNADDGCWITYHFPKDKLSEEEMDRIEEMDFSDLEEDGWTLDETETYFTGPLILEEVKDE
jgi:hypothetical protein